MKFSSSERSAQEQTLTLKRKRVLLGLALSLFVVIVFSAKAADIAIPAAPAGGHQLEILMDGTTDLAFVQDNSPTNEPVYRAEFQIDLNDLVFASSSGPSSNTGIFQLWDVDQPGPLPRQHLTVGLRLGPDGKRKIFAKIVMFDGTNTSVTWRNENLEPMELNLPDGPAGFPVDVRVEFQQGSTVGAADGVVSLSRANNFQPGVFATRTHSQVENALLNVDRVLVGAMSPDMDSTGSFFVDNFYSFRNLSTP